MVDSLFRKEALDHAQRRLEGEVVLAIPLSLKFLGVLALVLIVGVIGFASMASYSRKELASGWLTPDQGVIRALAPQGGRVERLLAEEGDVLFDGAPIARLRLDSETEDGATGAQILRALQDQLVAADHTAANEIARLEQEGVRLRALLEGYASEQSELDRQIELQSVRVELADDQVARAEELAERGYIAGRELVDRRMLALASRQELADLERAAAGLRRQITDAQAGLVSLPLQIETEQGRAASARAALSERISAQSARTETLVTAPSVVRVAAVPVRPGQSLAPGDTVAVLMPEDGQLVAELYLPTRAAGFIRVGQEVRVMYQAYPHQRFGTGSATITRISRTVLAPEEAAIPGLTLHEPVFRVEAVLARSEIVAYGETILLQPGLMVDADIVIDRRSLLEWLFDPLFAAGRRG